MGMGIGREWRGWDGGDERLGRGLRVWVCVGVGMGIRMGMG